MKKIIALSFILILMLLVILFVTSCSGESPQNNTDNIAKPDSPQDENKSIIESTTENPRLAIKEDIPEDLDFNGKKFNIAYLTWGMFNDYYFADEEIGEKMNDAIYRRTKNVEERLNIKINPIGIDENIQPPLSKSVKAGSDDYQLALNHCVGGVVELTTGGIVQDWNKIPVVDFTKLWWNQRMNQTLAIDNILLTAVSDFVIFDPNVIYFNKGMAKDLDMGDIYQLVRDGKWTWDKLSELAKLASRDLDGNGIFDENDQYGFVTHMDWMLGDTIQSCGMYITKIGEDGYPVNNLNTERFGSMINKLYDLIYVGNQTFLGAWDSNARPEQRPNESAVPMSSNRALFHMDPLSAGKRYRAYEVEFGILPFPKYDEGQTDYLSLSHNGLMMIPRTADPAFVGAVNEALAAESYRLTIPAYYDIVLTSKVARDDESAEMIDIIYKGAVYDFGYNFGQWNPISGAVTNILGAKSTDYASFMEKNEDKFNKHMRNVYDKIREQYDD